MANDKPWRNAAFWAQWEDRHINGEQHSFSHLTPFDMQLSRPGTKGLAPMLINIRVVFDCHVTTEANFEVQPHQVQGHPDFWVDSGNVCRQFHLDRYIKSLELPGIIKGLTDGKTKCYIAAYENYMVWKPVGMANDDRQYQIFFDIYRPHSQNQRLVLYVQSAYVKDVPRAAQREREKPFATVCAELARLITKKAKKR